SVVSFPLPITFSSSDRVPSSWRANNTRQPRSLMLAIHARFQGPAQPMAPHLQGRRQKHALFPDGRTGCNCDGPFHWHTPCNFCECRGTCEKKESPLPLAINAGSLAGTTA